MNIRSIFEQCLRETFPNLEEELSKRDIGRSILLAVEIQCLSERLRHLFPSMGAELAEGKLDRIVEIATQIYSKVGTGTDTHLMETLCNVKRGATAPSSESKETDKAERAGNPDSGGLGFAHHDGITVGYVDEVHGPGATPCPDYVPTREELRILARHWNTSALEFDTFYFYTGQVGSCDTRTQAFAERRVARIAGVLGRDSVEEVVGEVRDECRRRMGDRNWNIFENGTQAERERIWEETHVASREGSSAPGYVIEHLKEEAVKIFPELPACELAAALRFAANQVEGCSVKIEPCDHEWQTDADGYVRKSDLSKSVSVLQHCAKCRAMRQHEIYSDDPDYEAAVGLARQ